MKQYEELAKQSAELLSPEIDKMIKDGVKTEVIVEKAINDFQQLNNIKYPFKQTQIILSVFLIEAPDQKEPTEVVKFSMPPILSTEVMNIGDTVHVSPTLEKGFSDVTELKVSSIEHFIYSNILKTISVSAVVMRNNKEEYKRYIEEVKKFGGLTEDEVKEAVAKENGSASATPKSSPSEASDAKAPALV